jgi:hypothetical protein
MDDHPDSGPDSSPALVGDDKEEPIPDAQEEEANTATESVKEGKAEFSRSIKHAAIILEISVRAYLCWLSDKIGRQISRL